MPHGCFTPTNVYTEVKIQGDSKTKELLCKHLQQT